MIPILMPALSPTMTEGTLVRWLKAEGDQINAGEVIAEIETDKATMEVEAVDEGTLGKIVVKGGSNNVLVNSIIAVILESGDNKDDINNFIKEHNSANQQVEQSQESGSSEEPSNMNQHASNNNGEITSAIISSPTIDCSGMSLLDKVKNKNNTSISSPLAKKVAQELSIDITRISGTGPGGRVVKQDVIDIRQESFSTVQRNTQEAYIVNNDEMRKTIAKRLLQSKQTAPHFYLSIDCQIDKLLNIRKIINDEMSSRESPCKVSVNDIIIKAVAMALQEIPEANASWNHDNIVYYNNIDISVAVAIDGGLITPIVKNADQKTVSTISKEMKELAGKARNNTLKPHEFQGGGFTVSNLGMFGIKNFHAIINQPQSCILAIGKGEKRAVVIEDKIQIASVMDVTLSCDHRSVDGAVGAKFLSCFQKYIENPTLIFLQYF